MNDKMRIRNFLITVCIAPLLLSACGTAPVDHFYTLNPVALPVLDGALTNNVRRTAAVGSVKVPEMVDRPQLVIRQSANRVDILEQHRWAESLRVDIARVIAADLASQLHTIQVMPYGDADGQDADYRIEVDVEQFDAVADEAVTIEAHWSIRSKAGELLENRNSTIREPIRTGDTEQIAAAYGRTLAALSTEMAQAMLSMQQKNGR